MLTRESMQRRFAPFIETQSAHPNSSDWYDILQRHFASFIEAQSVHPFGISLEQRHFVPFIETQSVHWQKPESIKEQCAK